MDGKPKSVNYFNLLEGFIWHYFLLYCKIFGTHFPQHPFFLTGWLVGYFN